MYRDAVNPDLMDCLEGSIQNLHRTIKTQRPSLLDGGLPLALEGLVEEMQKVAGSSVSISWISDLEGRLGLTDEQAISFYRIAQEALSNALKHGNARHIEVGLEQDMDQSLRLRISDDGVGVPLLRENSRQDQSHFGLVLMQERALMINARLHIQATPGGGTTVVLEVVP
jgi:signal transduction histidine kinase